ncbi:MAG: ATP-binding protein [Chloroflexi bacterium]|nr:ATP-binding protein [Chloroflexota bacterium]
MVESTLPEVCGWWDTSRLERLLDNLLGNAVKYSPNGGTITLLVETEREFDGRWAVLRVRDEGIGIPEADLERVFDRFYRGSNVVGHLAGTGVGLDAGRRIVEQHGGTIAIESREGEGATITIRLPLDVAGDPAVPVTGPASAAAAGVAD